MTKENGMTSDPPLEKVTVTAVSVLVHVQAASVFCVVPSATECVTAVFRQVPLASNTQVVVEVWRSPGTWTVVTACQVPTRETAGLVASWLIPWPNPLPGRVGPVV